MGGGRALAYRRRAGRAGDRAAPPGAVPITGRVRPSPRPRRARGLALCAFQKPKKVAAPPAGLGARVDRYAPPGADPFTGRRGRSPPPRGGERLGFAVSGPEEVAAPPAGRGARVGRYRCCLPALAGFST